MERRDFFLASTCLAGATLLPVDLFPEKPKVRAWVKRHEIMVMAPNKYHPYRLCRPDGTPLGLSGTCDVSSFNAAKDKLVTLDNVEEIFADDIQASADAGSAIVRDNPEDVVVNLVLETNTTREVFRIGMIVIGENASIVISPRPHFTGDELPPVAVQTGPRVELHPGAMPLGARTSKS